MFKLFGNNFQYLESLDQEETFAQQGALAWNLEKKQKLDKEQSFQENSERFQQKEKVGTIEVLKTYGILANIIVFFWYKINVFIAI